MLVTMRLMKMMVTMMLTLLLLHCVFLISYFNNFHWDSPTGSCHYPVIHVQRIWPNQKLVFSIPNVNKKVLFFCPTLKTTQHIQL